MLTLWLDSYRLELTPPDCAKILAGLDNAEAHVVFHRLDQEPYKTQKAYTKPGFKFCYKGKRWAVPKHKLDELRMKCSRVRDGGQAEFKLGIRVVQVTDATFTRLKATNPSEERMT
jgi:hypothetical protein